MDLSSDRILNELIYLWNWPHPADVVKIIEDNGNKEQTIQIYIDGSKNEYGVGSGVAIFVGKELKAQLKFKLDSSCSNNQAEQLTIAKALEVTDAIDIAENSPRTIAIFTDNRIAIDSLQNVNNHSYLIEDGFGCLVVIILATGTRVRGFKPCRRRWIFRASGKSSVCLPSEGK